MPTFRWIESGSVGRLAVTQRPAGGDELEEDLQQMRAAGADILVSMLGHDESVFLGLSDEANVCAQVGLEFVQAPTIDRSVPEAPHLVYRTAKRLAGELEAGRNVVVHCRMGIGRSSMMVACIMALQGVEPTEAFERISRARGIDVPDTLAQKLWVDAFAATFGSQG